MDQPIRFRNTTVTAARKRTPDEHREKIRELVDANVGALYDAIDFCRRSGIGSFRVNSQILPLCSHTEFGYRLEEIPDGANLIGRFEECGHFARQHDIRLTFHPDQFVVLNSPRPDVVESSLRELEYQTRVSEWIGADVINIHAGGVYGDKPSALERLQLGITRLSQSARERLTLENDDKSYRPVDLLPICRSMGIPLVYDVHHHRCNRDDLSIEEATHLACETWNREPLFHISSPKNGWGGAQPRQHHDFIEVTDFPQCWCELEITVEVEAKQKEHAVLQLLADLG